MPYLKSMWHAAIYLCSASLALALVLSAHGSVQHPVVPGLSVMQVSSTIAAAAKVTSTTADTMQVTSTSIPLS